MFSFCIRISCRALIILSLMVCLLVVALWIRSYWRGDLIAYRKVDRIEPIYHNLGSVRTFDYNLYDYRLHLFASYQGRLTVGLFSADQNMVPRDSWSWDVSQPGPVKDDPWFGFDSRGQKEGKVGIRWCPRIRSPHAVVAAMFAIAPIGWLVHHGTRKKRPPFACRKCGYDLRASPERCPECGAAINLPQSKTL